VTLSWLDAVPFEFIYSFKYSARPFTKATRFGNQVDESENSLRLSRFNKKYNQVDFQRANQYQGKVLEVMMEKRDYKAGYLSGRSTQNKLVHFAGSEHLKGKTVSVKIQTAYPQVLYGGLL